MFFKLWYNKTMIFSKKTYLDYATAQEGNPSSLHTLGKKLRQSIDKTRYNFARVLSAHTDEIIFTASSSSSIALGIMGFVYAYHKNPNKKHKTPHVITSSIEHSSVLESCRMLVALGLLEVTYVSPQDYGIINTRDIESSIKENTILVSVGFVNSELGTIQDIESIFTMLNRYVKTKNQKIFMHLDATQAAVHLDIAKYIRKGIELISFNSVKLGGSSGIGMLYKKRNIKNNEPLIISALYGGGSQEYGLWPGTQNVDLIKSFYNAYVKNLKNMEKQEIFYKKINNSIVFEFEKVCNKYGVMYRINTDKECIKTLPSYFSFSLKPFSGEQIMIELSSRGIYVSSKSACNSENNVESYVISEVRKKHEFDYSGGLWGTVRVSFGPKTKIKDIKRFISAMDGILKTYKNMLY
jgi:cysteine desulfurase